VPPHPNRREEVERAGVTARSTSSKIPGEACGASESPGKVYRVSQKSFFSPNHLERKEMVRTPHAPAKDSSPFAIPLVSDF